MDEIYLIIVKLVKT